MFNPKETIISKDRLKVEHPTGVVSNYTKADVLQWRTIAVLKLQEAQGQLDQCDKIVLDMESKQ